MGIMGQQASAGFSGEILPTFRYNAVAGRAYAVDRVENNGEWSSDEAELDFPIRFVIDFETIEVGPMAFVNNRPDFLLVRLADVETGTASIPVAPPLKDDEGKPLYRFGFRTRIYNKELGLREWRGQQKVVLAPLDALYEQWKEHSDGKAAGKLPVVTMAKPVIVKRAGGKGQDYAPILSIDKYVPRPAGLTPPAEPEAVSAPEPAPALLSGKPSKAVPPPAAKPAKEDDDEF